MPRLDAHWIADFNQLGIQWFIILLTAHLTLETPPWLNLADGERETEREMGENKKSR